MSFLRRLWDALVEGEPDPGPPRGDALRLAQVETELERLRPAVRADGGELRLLEVSAEGDVHLRLQGACRSCHAQETTLRAYLEPELRRTLSWVRRVELR